jgi:hypothetical protein
VSENPYTHGVKWQQVCGHHALRGTPHMHVVTSGATLRNGHKLSFKKAMFACEAPTATLTFQLPG